MTETTEDLKIVTLDCERQGLTLRRGEVIGKLKIFNNSSILDSLENTSTRDDSGQRLENKDTVI